MPLMRCCVRVLESNDPISVANVRACGQRFGRHHDVHSLVSLLAASVGRPAASLSSIGKIGRTSRETALMTMRFGTQSSYTMSHFSSSLRRRASS
jgi:hypothetical protein